MRSSRRRCNEERKISKNTMKNIIAAAIGITTIFGSLYLAQTLSGQSAIDAFAWLIWSTGGIAAIAFAAVIAVVIIAILSLKMKTPIRLLAHLSDFSPPYWRTLS